ncbi:hypothetical protein DKX38_001001 [Salix brachista]|uniref:MYB-CC type transcription factor LHEQLE-containing domain-containing protein n=1 Tax=Salix brachista TaxID=2182728 RepID=A0A5N5P3J0_9ROSI|nr:hypothetical protein DKX38_001001 [Salix brachista]
MERTVFGGGGNYPYENGVVMMTRDPKPRLRWTSDLHDRFVDAVTKLGGPDRNMIRASASFLLGFDSILQKLYQKQLLPTGFTFRGNSKVSLEINGIKGFDIVPLKESFAEIQTGAPGSETEHFRTKQREQRGFICKLQSWFLSDKYQLTRNGYRTRYVQNREIPVAEALNCQIEVQKTLRELEFDTLSRSSLQQVQKKLQMRIEAQGKYMQSILEKAQKSLSRNLNEDGNGDLEATRAQLTGFNLAISSLIENMNAEDRKPRVLDLKGVNIKTNGSAQTLETTDAKHHLHGDSIHFDLNTKGTYDFVAANGSELDLKMLSYRR